jgi:hypothetical protein
MEVSFEDQIARIELAVRHARRRAQDKIGGAL